MTVDKDPIICGGQVFKADHRKSCYTYKEDNWMTTFELNVARYGAAMIQTPSKELLITGGNDYFVFFKSTFQPRFCLFNSRQVALIHAYITTTT